MTEKEFIDISIKKILENFSNIFVVHFYRPEAKTHFFQIHPPSVYENDLFNEFSADIVYNYYENKYENSLCFISFESSFNTNEVETHYLGVDADINNLPSLDISFGEYDLTSKKLKYLTRFHK